jgi:hypothetical protein
MNYLLLIAGDHETTPAELAAMQREVPGWVEEMDGRGVRLLGRELELPEAAATVRVRGGETLVSDGPFAETKEFLAGFDLLECADLDEAIEVATKHASSWFHMVEVRPVKGGLRLSDKASAFARMDDSSGRPYLLIIWVDEEPAADDPVIDQIDVWRQDAEAKGVRVLGSALEGPDAATTVRVRQRQTLLGDGPFAQTDEYIGGIEVVSCADRQQAIALAAAHPLARSQAIEVRPFWSE